MTDDVELLKVGQAYGRYRVGCGGYEKCELRGSVAFGPNTTHVLVQVDLVSISISFRFVV